MRGLILRHGRSRPTASSAVLRQGHLSQMYNGSLMLLVLPGGWSQHQLQGSESILMCQYDRLDYHGGRMSRRHVGEG